MHQTHPGLAHSIDPIQIDGQDPVPFGFRKFVDRDASGEGVDTRIVDQDIEPAKCAGDPLHGNLDLAGIRHVQR